MTARLDPFEPLWTPRDAGRFLGESVKTTYRRAKLGQIPCYRIAAGTRKTVIRFSPSELAAWVESRRVLPPGVRSAPPLPRSTTAREARRA